MIGNSFKKIFKRNKVVIYTAIFGDYDDLKNPPEKLAKQCDFICFTDNKKIKSDKYKIVYCDKKELNNSKESRRYKILPHLYLPSRYEYSIWVDASIKLNNFKINNFIEEYLGKDGVWAAFIHPERSCVYEELEACLQRKKDDYYLMKNQIGEYEKEGYPKKNGLVANGFILRKHNDPEVIRVSREWWKEVKKNSVRDQLSFCYVAWKKNFKFYIINDYLWDNKYFKVLGHKK
ncbi:MAG: DUF616 domain-containing protein [Candidatus Moranbacteria bacterium]|jgi:hypothetical protein|nr:DUF616 domain-containing protein [Candidatus Moranbacteria bacterium]